MFYFSMFHWYFFVTIIIKRSYKATYSRIFLINYYFIATLALPHLNNPAHPSLPKQHPAHFITHKTIIYEKDLFGNQLPSYACSL
jgi:hypothetical protein